MPKRVVVIASGETERRALPRLLARLRDAGIEVSVRIPPRHAKLSEQMARKLILSAWDYDSGGPEKFVVLVDADGKPPDPILAQFSRTLSKTLDPRISGRVQYAHAQWHLEAWYFADSTSLRNYIGRALGSSDTSKPDSIQNPKLHLKHLLGDNRPYTAVVSEEIASKLDSRTIAERSPSFRTFVEAVENGAALVSA